MSVPLDRLYNHLDSLCDHDVIIYRWFPHGSKKPEDLCLLKPCNWFETMSQPMLICHDQEPLDFEFYQNQDLEHAIKSIFEPIRKLAKTLHLRGIPECVLNIHDVTILVHSEQNSKQLEIYEKNGFVGAYWWSHAAIARDWFRYAEHDTALNYSFENIQKDFLVYNRAWSGSREYRLKFAEMLLQHDLVKDCNTKFAPVDNGVHYTQHIFKNQKFQTSSDIESAIPLNNFESSASADYFGDDYITSGIEVVLETIYDDHRWHLTEKSLRPVACKKPFILAATPGSLQYLKKYGFETFSPYINEHYDTITDPLHRMAAITQEMQRIQNLDAESKKHLYQKLNDIAERNQRLFFSKEWEEKIWQELQTNLNEKIDFVSRNHAKAKYLKQINLKEEDLEQFRKSRAGNDQQLEKFLNWLKARGIQASQTLHHNC